MSAVKTENLVLQYVVLETDFLQRIVSSEKKNVLGTSYFCGWFLKLQIMQNHLIKNEMRDEEIISCHTTL